MNQLPGLDTEALTAWLDAAHPDLAAGPLTAEVIAGGRSNLTYRIDGARLPLVLRRPPLGHVLSSAHDMRREHRVISALAGSAVPVPVAIDLVDDDEGPITGTTFLLMERAPGRVLATREQNADYSRAGLHALGLELATMLAALHAVDPGSVGLAGFGRPDGYLERQVRTWRRQLDASRSRPTPELDALQDRLDDDIPSPRRAGIVHGDYRLDNALVDGPEPHISAILDWEMATLGDPLVDVGILALYWELALRGDEFRGLLPDAVSADAGYPAVEDLIDAYAVAAGVESPDLRWYRAFAAAKLAVILEGIHFRYQAGGTVGDGFDRIGDLVEPLARLGRGGL